MRAEPLASRLYVQTVLEYERCLPDTGEVLVAPGCWVKSDDIIARGERPGAVRVIDAARELAIACDRLPAYLRVRVGQEVQANQVLAASGFMGWRTVRSPVAGRVARIATGRIFAEEPAQPVELRALLPGQVIRILPGRGAVIRAVVSRVVGTWGTGSECYGPLVLRSEAAGAPLRWTSVDLACRGKIVVGGQCLDRRALLRAARFRALGLVVGGLAEHLRALAEELGLTIMVTDALGAMPMAGPIFDLLAQHDGRDGLLLGGAGEHGRAMPALNIPLESVQGPINVAPERPLAVGDRVRVTRAPYLGATGWVEALVEQEGEPWVRVRLDRGLTSMINYRNLERLG